MSTPSSSSGSDYRYREQVPANNGLRVSSAAEQSVGLLHRDLQGVDGVGRLACERLVDLVDVDVLDLWWV